jgi:hypothetical protein
MIHPWASLGRAGRSPGPGPGSRFRGLRPAGWGALSPGKPVSCPAKDLSEQPD